MRGLKDKVVLVTGGAGGIGSAICRRMAGEGAVVAVCDLDGAAAEAVAAGIGEAGGRARAWRLDITDQAAVVAAVAAVEAALGPIDVLVNNAGWDRAMDFLDSDKALWEKVVAVNLWGHLHMHHAVLTGMKARGRGRVVNIASDAARVGSSGESVYSLCKGGLVAFTKTLARELARQRICLNVLCPGPNDTPLLKELCGDGERSGKLRDAFVRATPFGRLGEPEDIAGAAAFLASDDAAFMTGQVISVSGGLTMAG